jgi:hypothetical protein
MAPRRRNGRPRRRARTAGRRRRTRKRSSKARKWQTLARKRGIQRWSSLVSATSSRLAKANGMRAFLGERCWRDFVGHAAAHYREAFLQAFTPRDGVLCCKGPLGSAGPCPQRFRVDARQLASSDGTQRDIATQRLKLLHVDHTYDVQHICDTWKSLSVPCPPRWDHGICARKLCRLLFGVKPAEGQPCLTFRCAVLSLGSQQPCHHVARPHYAHTLRAEQLRAP